MLPTQLKAEQFSNYPPEARQMAIANLALLQQLPPAFLPLLLRELITYDWKFPAERNELDKQFAYLRSLSAEQLKREMQPFVHLQLSPELEQGDWVNTPLAFSEQLSAHLWATHQVDAFRTASIEYVHRLNDGTTDAEPSLARLGIVMIGQGVTENRYRLFRKLRPHGVYFTNVQPKDGRHILFEAAAARAAAHPIPFGHWYIDGADNVGSTTALTCIAYNSLDAPRAMLLTKMRKVMQSGSGGPEILRTILLKMRPEELGFSAAGDQAVLNRFRVSLLTEGSGTQLFSTTFVQWSAREVLRRAQPVTLLARFTPRQREQSMAELLTGTQQKPGLDAPGSLIDADMGAYYTWINQQRLPGANRASFLVWFEDHNEAMVIAPSFDRGREDGSAVDLGQLIARIS